MTKKIIPFEINLKSSQRAGFTFQPRPQILTNDANSAELNFIITDASSVELTGSSATVLLFMKDGSFFQNTDVTRVNNTFVYTIKPNQAKHKGIAQAQLVIKIGTVENASPLMEFEIIGGLETKPIVERDIQDWSSLTAEAKAFVDQIEGFTLESFVENKMGQELANLEVNYAGRLTGLESADQTITAQLAHIVTDVKLTEGEDATAKIQAALDKKGHVRIVSPGTFLTGRLLIDDDTKFELLPGVILKRKDITNHYILVNKGHVLGYRNKNITLKGGKWELNRDGNPNAYGDLSVDQQSWSGAGILFHKVDGLIVEDTEDIGDEWKYCYLFVDINQGTFRNIKMNNVSDGIHLQPPLNNITIENISGVTHDDLISFTMGDYPRYSLGQHGNIENVQVRNIHAGETTAQIIKMVGSGLDGKSVFKNMKFENISGYATIHPIHIMKEDQATPNPCLKNTQLENIVFENINMEVSDKQSYFCIGGVSGDVTIRKLKVKQSNSARPILLQDCNLGKVVLEDIDVVADGATVSLDYLVRVDNRKGEVLDQLIIKDSNITPSPSSTGSIIYPSGDVLRTLIIDNVKAITPGGTFIVSDGVSTSGTDVFINNSTIDVHMLGLISTKMDINISNSKIITNNRTLHMNDGADIRLLSNNSDLVLTINGTTALRKLSVSGDITTDTLLAAFTPLLGDEIIYDRPTDQKNKGNYFFDGTKWCKTFTLTDFTTDIAVGTINAHSTVDFSVGIANVGSYKSVVASPTFALPPGVVYSVVHRSIDVVRLRIANVTAAPIVFNTTTEKTWNFKIINDSALV